MAILVALLLFLAAASFGRSLLDRFKMEFDCSVERLCFAAAIGFGVGAYSVLAVGSAGLLTAAPVASIWIALALVGWQGFRAICIETVLALKQLPTRVRFIFATDRYAQFSATAALFLTFAAIAAVVCCFKPPAGAEWDAISYHLADPAQFILDHRITSLVTEHHSNFPFTVEMLFTTGLMFSGYALANLMHFTLTALTVLASFSAARKLGGRYAGWIAAILLVGTPVIFWESTVSYVEMGLSLYVTLGVIACLKSCSSTDIKTRTQYAALTGVMLGFALGTKYLALIPFALVCALMLYRTRSFKRTLSVAAIAVAIASPWYLKNAVNLHNPVYPYAYKIFSNSRYWSANRAQGYEAEQARFGSPHSLKQPVVAARNLLQSPWDLMTLPFVNPASYSNAGEFSFLTLFGGLYCALNVCLVLCRRKLGVDIGNLLSLGVLQVVAWFFVSQVSRYLVSTLPLLAITGSCGVSALVASVRNSRQKSTVGTINLACVITATLLVCLQFLSTMWVVFAAEPAESPASVPLSLSLLSEPDTVDKYLTRHLDNFAVTSYLNKNSAPTDKVLLYEDTRGFYINRHYIWANEVHSTFIPYNGEHGFADGVEMTRWFVTHGYRFALVNLNFAPEANDRDHPDPDFPRGPVGSETGAFAKWYLREPLKPVGVSEFRWKGLVADAVRRGLWTDVGVSEHGVILFHLDDTAANGNTTGGTGH